MNTRRHLFAANLVGASVDPEYRKSVFFSDTDAKNTSLQNASPAAEKTAFPRGTIPAGAKVIRSACFSCNTACEVLVFVDRDSGKILKVEGDPESPITKGVLCAKGLASKDLVENPQRLRTPLKRIGKRGEGKWEKISWDDALSLIAEKLQHL